MELSISLDLAYLIAFLIGSFATFRLSYFITNDKLSEGPRDWLILKLVQLPEGGLRKTGVRAKLAYLIGCPFCVGIWVSMALVCVFAGAWPWAIGWAGLILWLSIAGGQASLQQWLYGRR